MRLQNVKSCWSPPPSCQDLEEVDKSKQKKWTSSQSREFSELFTLLAYLVQCCDTSPHLTHSKYIICYLDRNCHRAQSYNFPLYRRRG